MKDTIRVEMVAHTGMSVPDDWDGGPVLGRDGKLIAGATRDSIGWRSIYGHPPAFTAYMPHRAATLARKDAN